MTSQNKPRTKGILLAGGTGSRLYPLTFTTNKSLLPVYDKPLIYYPLSILMISGIQDILLITTPRDLASFQTLFGDGSQWGISIQYAVQENPKGIAHAFIVAEDFIGDDPVCMILGDNIFYGQGLAKILQESIVSNHGATIFGYYVSDPQHYGVITFDQNRNVINLEEKPKNPASNYVATGLYMYDNDVVRIAHSIKPSARNELEITEINKCYLSQGKLKATLLSRGTAWMDVGMHHSLVEANQYIEIIERRQSLKVACLEEIAWRMGLINKNDLLNQAKKYGRNNSYGRFLFSLIEDDSLRFVSQFKNSAESVFEEIV